ncbi:MAG TPA: hypothetical protein DD400_01440 [Rhodospirillaceae bacterium]|nr:hypothetical protein [Rhodospirillaceae bacterium]
MTKIIETIDHDSLTRTIDVLVENKENGVQGLGEKLIISKKITDDPNQLSFFVKTLLVVADNFHPDKKSHDEKTKAAESVVDYCHELSNETQRIIAFFAISDYAHKSGKSVLSESALKFFKQYPSVPKDQFCYKTCGHEGLFSPSPR